MIPELRCLIPTCDSGGKLRRGLCLACYTSAGGRVRAKKTTWEELERLGLAVKAKAKPSAFSVELQKRLRAEEEKALRA